MSMRSPSHQRLHQSRAAAAGIAAACFIAALAACSDNPSGPTAGSLVITIAGLPADVQNAVSVTGPAGSTYQRVLNRSDTLRNLVPGRYTISAPVVTHAAGVYAALTPSQQVEVVASNTPSAISVNFEITTGAIALDIAGLPDGASGSVTVSGPGGFTRELQVSATLAGLQPGTYQISSSAVVAASGHRYSPVPIAQSVGIIASETPRTIRATYVLSTGALEVTITGLPQGANSAVVLTGPGGFNRSVTGSTTLVGLFPGAYSVQASNVTIGTAWYAPTPPQAVVEVPPSLTPARVTVAYVELNLPPPSEFNLSIDGMYITQAVQSYAGTVPMIAGMPGLLRVFVKASAPNTSITTVRLRIYRGSELLETMTLQPNFPSVPTTISEGTRNSSWNGSIPASMVQPGLRFLADVDPTNTIPEANENDNTFPASGTPYAVSVEFTAPLNVTFVPVLQSTTGLTGNVSSQNLEDFLAFARKILPIKDYNASVHDVFTTAGPALESNNGNNGWLQVLSEINTMRVAEGSNNYYVGIVGTTYNSGVAGMAFAPGKASVAWDKLPSAASITAHELGHSLGRLHSPCGGAGSPDPAYPHAFGTIGVYGYDVATGVLKPPGTSDIMGYCGFGWISDYNYLGILNYRQTTPNASLAPNVSTRGSPAAAERETFIQSGTPQHSLVVWGRIENGRPVLEPAFSANTRRVLPVRAGPHRIEAVAADGRVLFAYSFEGERPADFADASARHFAFAIPLDGATQQSIATLRLTSESGAQSVQAVGRVSIAPDALDAAINTPGEVQFRLRDPAVKLAVVRERSSQRIVAFLRPQAAALVVRSRASDFDVHFSDGVHSTTRAYRAVRR